MQVLKRNLHPTLRKLQLSALLCLSVGVAHAEDLSRSIESSEVKENNVRLGFQVGIQSVKTTLGALSGSGGSITLEYSLESPFLFAFSLQQIFASKPLFSALSTSLELDLGVRLDSRFRPRSASETLMERKARVGSQVVLTEVPGREAGLLFGVSIGQLFFNTQSTASYSGVGAWVRYELPSRSSLQWGAGARVFRWINANDSGSSWQVNLGPRFYF
jgi:hypothetical protein